MQSLSLRRVIATDLPVPGEDPWYAQPEDPALSVMTDFRERSSITVSENAAIDEALEHMKHAGVRAAFALDDTRRLVVGLITAYDIISEKPIRHMHSMSSLRRDVRVRDIMQDIADWHVADIRDIEQSTVGAVWKMFEETRLTHVPVMETDEYGDPRLRGLLSAARVKRLLSKATPSSPFEQSRNRVA